jgi:hypothetical protein
MSGLVDFGKSQIRFPEFGVVSIIFASFIGYSFLLGLGIGTVWGIAGRLRR